MISVKLKSFAVVLMLLMFTGLFTAGCGQKPKATGWVNTQSMPGHTFNKNKPDNSTKRNNSAVIYLGSGETKSGSNFGPGDVSFEFRDLK